VYENRLLAYVDVLGWKTACADYSNLDRIERALAVIHNYSKSYSQSHRKKLLAIPQHIGTPNPLFLKVQFAAFSDHFVFSKPADFGGRIFSVQDVCLELLKLGFLTRGAIVLGDLHHLDNEIFGPALIDAVRIEETEAIFPRIIVADDVVQHCEQLAPLGDDWQHYVIEDPLGRRILNVFGILGNTTRDPEGAQSLIELNVPIKQIVETVNARIREYAEPKHHKYREKWIYLRSLIEERALKMYPLLRDALE
jgi:hypothetical protein